MYVYVLQIYCLKDLCKDYESEEKVRVRVRIRALTPFADIANIINITNPNPNPNPNPYPNTNLNPNSNPNPNPRYQCKILMSVYPLLK